jgi:tripartite-type tricarboxylate transporter receptor subunit TctC
MKTLVFSFLQALACAAGTLLLSGAARAEPVQDYPSKPVRWIIPTSPGAGTDVTGRLFGQMAGESWKQAVVADNKPGASGMLGLDALAVASPDGYTLMFMSVSQFIDATLLHKYSFEAHKDFTPISLLASTPLILLAHADVPVNHVSQLIALAKKQPQALNYGSGGSGGLTHLAMEVFLKKAGIEATHIPYKGSGPAVVDLLAGRVQLAYSTPPAVLQHIKSGRLKALAVTTETRLASLPDVPTMNELGYPAASISTWYGLFGPAHMPAELVEKISRTVRAATRQVGNKDKISLSGIDPVANSPAEFAQLLARERQQIIGIVKAIGFKKEQ